MKKICLLLPSLSSGGMERVMTEIACYFTTQASNHVTMVVMTKGKAFYQIPDNVGIVQPNLVHDHYPRPVFTLKTLLFVRKALKRLRPDVILSFGGKYNSFVLIASFGLGLRVFISDRSRPGISYGKFLDRVNSF